MSSHWNQLFELLTKPNPDLAFHEAYSSRQLESIAPPIHRLFKEDVPYPNRKWINDLGIALHHYLSTVPDFTRHRYQGLNFIKTRIN